MHNQCIFAMKHSTTPWTLHVDQGPPHIVVAEFLVRGIRGRVETQGLHPPDEIPQIHGVAVNAALDIARECLDSIID